MSSEQFNFLEELFRRSEEQREKYEAAAAHATIMLRNFIEGLSDDDLDALHHIIFGISHLDDPVDAMRAVANFSGLIQGEVWKRNPISPESVNAAD